MVRVRQVTFDDYGHTLNHRQAISPDGQWAVYDTRNEDAQIPRTERIEMVNLDSGEIQGLYRTPTHSLHGPGVGAAAFHPHEPRIVFIHGLENCTAEHPYSAARRFGAIVELASPGIYVHAEARSVQRMPGQRRRSIGSLSGGTHAHSWSNDGWISFTYNDAWLERMAQTDNRVHDRRTVGFMVPGMPVVIDGLDAEDFSGSFGAFLAATISQSARHASDDIERAVEECWIGKHGYVDERGIQRAYALAFQGVVRDDLGRPVNEIFVCDLLNAMELSDLATDSMEMGSGELLRPMVGCTQRRLTRTLDRKFPGVQGPRCWLVSSSDGKYIFAPMRDDRGVVQVVRVATAGGDVDLITDMEHSVEGQISLNADGTKCSCICDQRICLVDVASGQPTWLTDRMEGRLSGAIHFVGEHRVVFNCYVGADSARYLQVFVGELD